MLPRQFNSYGSQLDTELRAFLAFVVAKALKRAPHTLPPLTDTQLWHSFKLAATKINPYAGIPTAIISPLNPGDFFAIEAGRMLETSYYPEGEHFRQILTKAKNLTDTQLDRRAEVAVTQCLLVGLLNWTVPSILRFTGHPKAKAFGGNTGAASPHVVEANEMVKLFLIALHDVRQQQLHRDMQYP